MFVRFLLFIYLAGLVGCGPKKPTSSYELIIEKTVLLADLSGSSGLAFHKGRAIIISDNIPGYELLDTSNFTHIFFPFYPGASAVRQDKNIKEDFENVCVIEWNDEPYVVALGSGSITATRESLLYFSADSPAKKTIIKVPRFFTAIRNQLKINTAALNIEASFSTKDSFYFLNRGTNDLIAMKLSDIQSGMSGDTLYTPALNTRHFKLPVLDSFPIAFSGACYYRDDLFLFTASLEKTTDWVADGEVGGSWIGMARLDGTVMFLLPLMDTKGKMLIQKLESLDIVEMEKNGDISICAVADNDNGQSTWFNVLLRKEK